VVDDYRLDFNGKETDNETNWQDYSMRAYDPRIARFVSIDPIAAYYPELTPYQFASNTPVQAIDIDGLEMAKATKGLGSASSKATTPTKPSPPNPTSSTNASKVPAAISNRKLDGVAPAPTAAVASVQPMTSPIEPATADKTSVQPQLAPSIANNGVSQLSPNNDGTFFLNQGFSQCSVGVSADVLGYTDLGPKGASLTISSDATVAAGYEYNNLSISSDQVGIGIGPAAISHEVTRQSVLVTYNTAQFKSVTYMTPGMTNLNTGEVIWLPTTVHYFDPNATGGLQLTLPLTQINTRTQIGFGVDYSREVWLGGNKIHFQSAPGLSGSLQIPGTNKLLEMQGEVRGKWQNSDIR
jgi:RHS repeat-associated protein